MESAASVVEHTFHEESGRILATLIAATGDFALAEDALQDAMLAALRQWPVEGVPRNPPAWLTQIARRRAIDRLRRDATLLRKQEALQALTELEQTGAASPHDDDAAPFPDERLKLIFTCCHPALALEARVALTLRTLGGLSSAEVAAAFLVPVTAMRQRLVRAQRKIRDAGIPYRVPPAHLLPERLDGVLAVLYLIFNEGYAATAGDALIRHDLCAEAIRLARVLVDLLTASPSCRGSGGARPAGADAAAPRAASRARGCRGRPRAARRSRPRAVGQRRDRGGHGPAGPRARAAPPRSLSDPSGHRRATRAGARTPRRPTGSRSRYSTDGSPA